MRRSTRDFLVELAITFVQIVMVLACLLLPTALGCAQDAEEAPADACAELRTDDAPDPSRLELEGVPGMWFPMATARLMLCEVRELRLRRRVAELDAREIRIFELRITSFEERLSLAVEARDELESVLEAAERRAREATESANDWTRSPALWFAVGVVVAVVVFVAGAVIAAELSP